MTAPLSKAALGDIDAWRNLAWQIGAPRRERLQSLAYALVLERDPDNAPDAVRESLAHARKIVAKNGGQVPVSLHGALEWVCQQCGTFTKVRAEDDRIKAFDAFQVDVLGVSPVHLEPIDCSNRAPWVPAENVREVTAPSPREAEPQRSASPADAMREAAGLVAVGVLSSTDPNVNLAISEVLSNRHAFADPQTRVIHRNPHRPGWG